ncbi:MAG: BMP family ABC transporter substrate-binding protein [Peptoniphilaceae bacterium]|nr:BMP family ABC transporter substrate-binding protein [Peptoniphilaceae bacterium]MDD7383101.1 BMP family ABC transporter substrate-binding protein [Peptoniphilaceae bacterium]MDY3737536.1 BMP family ABC transporter substrate-binding protein [Peptoniphilaceae bacterium]
MQFKKLLLTTSLVLSTAIFAACQSGSKAPEGSQSSNVTADNQSTVENVVNTVMITDQGGVNDKSFNQSAYEGLTKLKDEGKIKFNFIESHSEADYAPNIDTALNEDPDIVYTIGYALYDDTDKAAKANPDVNFAIVDNANLDNTKNLLGITFADNENSFLVGYIAGMTTKTNNVGFVGGMKSDVIDRFEFGFRAGVKQAAREKKEDIEVQVQYADSYADAEKGKSIANQMYQKGADIVFHAAGGTGEGVISSAIENDKYVIGVDRDQSEEAPDNMLVSTVKGVNIAVAQVAKDLADGKFEGGKTVSFGLKDGDACTIAYAKNDLVSDEIKENVEKIRSEIIDGTIEVPQNEDEFTSMGYDK